MGERRGKARRRGPDAMAQFGRGAAVDFRLLMNERVLIDALRLPLALLAMTRLRIAHAMTDAMIDEGVEQGLSLDAAIDRAVAAVEEPDVSWVLEGRMPPCLMGGR